MIANPFDGPTIRQAKQLLNLTPQPADIVQQLDRLRDQTPEDEKYKFRWLYEAVRLDDLVD